MSHVIIGTAGHIDHGKTALVRALTGTDTDRLKEEKERQITIDLGFAFLGDRAAIIDVPGHERFIKNMVAGVATIDMVLFVIAADDGVMPDVGGIEDRRADNRSPGRCDGSTTSRVMRRVTSMPEIPDMPMSSNATRGWSSRIIRSASDKLPDTNT